MELKLKPLKDYEIYSGCQKARKLLNTPKNWKGLKTKTNWTGTKDAEVGELHHWIMLECLYRLLVFYIQDETQTVTSAEVDKWVLETLEIERDALASEDEQTFTRLIAQANSTLTLDGQKELLPSIHDLLCEPNPIVWLKLKREKKSSNYFIELGEYAEEFYKRMTEKGENYKRCSYKAPTELPENRKRSGKQAEMIHYAELETSGRTEQVLEILERRHIWLKPKSYEIAEQMTINDANFFLQGFEKFIFSNRSKGYLSPEKILKQRQILRRLSLLEKLQNFPVDEYYPLKNRFYSQSSGRIQPQWLHPGDISEKAGKSERYPGGVRQAIFCADSQGVEISACDCNASAWQLVSILLGDEKTQEIACGENCNFNTSMTDEAIKGDYFVKEKLEEENGRDNARKLVKKLLMTVLYGSTAYEQYKAAKAEGLDGYWQPPKDQQKNGAHRFLEDCKNKFPVLKYYVPLMRKVAKIGCQKKGIFRLPYIFEENAWLNFDHPKMKSERIRFTRKVGKNRPPKYYSVSLQFPISKVEDGKFVEADSKEVAKVLPPSLVHSIDSAIIKHFILILDRKLPENYGFATIHDCVLFPKGVISSEEIKQIWNESFRLTYKSLGRLLESIIEILKLDEKEAGQYLEIAENAYKKWNKNVENKTFLDLLCLSTSLEY